MEYKKFTQEEVNNLIINHESFVNSLPEEYNDFTKCQGAEKRIVLIGADVSGLDFSSSELERAEFRKCKMVKTNFNNSDLTCSIFSDCDLTDATFLRSNIWLMHIGNCAGAERQKNKADRYERYVNYKEDKNDIYYYALIAFMVIIFASIGGIALGGLLLVFIIMVFGAVFLMIHT